MKTCQSCKWCDFNEDYPRYSQCIAPQSYTISAITGKQDIQELSSCLILRTDNKLGYPKCGTDGKWYKHKDSEEVEELQTPPEEKSSYLEKFVAWIKRS